MKRLLLSLVLVSVLVSPCFALALKNKETGFVQKEEFANLSEEANVYYAQNDIKNAQSILVSIPEEERTAQNWLLLGNLLQDNGKQTEAEFMYKKSISVDEKYYKAYYNLGVLYMQLDKPNLAAEQFLKVTKLKPDYAYGHYNLACAYIKLEKFSKARFELLDAIEINNNIPEFHYNLAYVYKQMKNEKAAKTYLEFYNKIMEK